MKQLFFIFSFLAFGAMAAIAQPTSGPIMTFEKSSHDYGFINQNADGLHKYKFTNTGNEPLIIKSAKPSCSCVKATFPQEPIMPGEVANIEVTYDTKRLGNFNKTVSVITNEVPNTHVLSLKGEVKDPNDPQGIGH